MHLDDLIIDEIGEMEIAPGFFGTISFISITIDVDEDTGEIEQIRCGRSNKPALILTDEGVHKDLFRAMKSSISKEYAGAISEHVYHGRIGRHEADRDQASDWRRESDDRTWA